MNPSNRIVKKELYVVDGVHEFDSLDAANQYANKEYIDLTHVPNYAVGDIVYGAFRDVVEPFIITEINVERETNDEGIKIAFTSVRFTSVNTGSLHAISTQFWGAQRLDKTLKKDWKDLLAFKNIN